jgi:alkylation response protein AidB-like acyl-CoA dehydrogenase
VIEENGQPRMLKPNVPEVRMAWVKRTDVRILDTWHTGGLRGTGSHDVVVENIRVPQRHTLSPLDGSTLAGPLGRMPIVCTMAAGYAAQLSGMGTAAVDAVVELMGDKPVVDPVRRSANDPRYSRPSPSTACVWPRRVNTCTAAWRACGGRRMRTR